MAYFSQNLIPPMTSNTAPSGIASASSTYNATYSPWRAFSGTNINDSDCWASATTNAWIQYEFPQQKVVSKYSMTNRNVSNANYIETPKSWIFMGSNDGQNWTNLSVVDNEPSWTSVQTRNYQFANSNAFKYYRLHVTTVHSGTIITIGKLEMFELIYEHKILLSSDDKYSIKDSTVFKMETDSEKNFLNYGADLISNFNGYVTKQKDIKSTNVILGIGKTFEHTIDMSKRRVDKIVLG